jgi:hypothetical protein
VAHARGHLLAGRGEPVVAVHLGGLGEGDDGEAQLVVAGDAAVDGAGLGPILLILF